MLRIGVLLEISLLASVFGQAPCGDLGDARSQSACLANNKPGKRERHMQRMEQCTFKIEPRVELVFVAEGSDLDHLKEIANTTVEAKTCEVPEGNGVWHFTRIGPFFTTGGYSWTSVWSRHDESMHSQWRVAHDGSAALSVSDHIVGSSNARGDLIGYPPIHQHHFHYGDASTPLIRDTLNAHGDGQCLGSPGVYCFLSEYPNDVAFELVPQIMIYAEFNDVRKSGSPPLEWYAFGGIFIHKPSHPKPMAMMWYNPAVIPMNLPKGHRGVTMYDTALESVSWMTGTMRSVEYVVASYFHAHSEMVDDIWLIDGSPSQLQLLSPPWIHAFSNVKSGAGTISQLKAHLRRHMPASGAKLICSYSASPHVEVVEGFERPFPRRVFCSFPKFKGGANLKWTMVGFYKAQVTGLTGQFGMHTTLRVAYIPASNITTHFSERCEQPPLTLELLAKDAGDMFDQIRVLGGYECVLPILRSYSDGWPTRADANIPFLFQLFWSAPLVLSLLVALALLRCCLGKAITDRALNAVVSILVEAAQALRVVFCNANCQKKKHSDQKEGDEDVTTSLF